nr:MAG TPA: hypothetical protein [Bacteriophage sp.]
MFFNGSHRCINRQHTNSIFRTLDCIQYLCFYFKFLFRRH